MLQNVLQLFSIKPIVQRVSSGVSFLSDDIIIRKNIVLLEQKNVELALTRREPVWPSGKALGW